MTRVWIVILLVMGILLALAVADVVGGTPDTYPNQHAQRAAGFATSFFIIVSTLLRRPSLQWAALVVAVAAIVWSISLSL